MDFGDACFHATDHGQFYFLPGRTSDMSRLNCRFGVKIATPKNVVSGLLTPLIAARITITGLRLVQLDAIPDSPGGSVLNILDLQAVLAQRRQGTKAP